MTFRLNGAAAPISAVLLTLPAIVAAAPAFAQAQEGQIIATIDLKGLTNTNPDVVRLAISAAGIKEGSPYHADAISQARSNILAKGLYTDVYIKTEVTPDHKVILSFQVFENPKIADVYITTNVPLSGKGVPRYCQDPTITGVPERERGQCQRGPCRCAYDFGYLSQGRLRRLPF